MMHIEIITLFPKGLRTMLNESIVARAQRFGKVRLEIVQLRDFATDRHGTVDDKPFGGGPGMVMKAEPVKRALDYLSARRPEPRPLVLYTSPQGQTLTQEMAEELAQVPRLQILCGHYKGLDQRAIDTLVDREISIGDYILTGGEPAAVVIVDAITRLLPDVLGDPESAAGDSFTRGLLDHPHYTQPAEWGGLTPPDVLLSGHHARIEAWRQQQAEERTEHLRPELYRRWKDREQG